LYKCCEGMTKILEQCIDGANYVDHIRVEDGKVVIRIQDSDRDKAVESQEFILYQKKEAIWQFFNRQGFRVVGTEIKEHPYPDDIMCLEVTIDNTSIDALKRWVEGYKREEVEGSVSDEVTQVMNASG